MSGVKNPPGKRKARTPRTQVHLRLPVPLVEELAAMAQDTGVSLNRYCEVALLVYLRFLVTEKEIH